jgi:predicted nuclease of predicted toxin-antitoxin system
MRFLVDAQLPPDLARWIKERGREAAAVREIGLREAKDSPIWDFALRDKWVLVTKDEDFALRVLQSSSGPQVVWLRIGNCTNPILFAWLAPLWGDLVKRIEAGERLVEVRRP